MLVDVDLDAIKKAWKGRVNTAYLKKMDKLYVRIQEGVYSDGFTFDNFLGPMVKDKFPGPKSIKEFDPDEVSCFGVVDDLEQLLDLISDSVYVKSEDRLFVVSLREINKLYDGGWRWYKAGPYYGKQNSIAECLADEPEIEKVFSYRIIELNKEMVQEV